MSLADIQYERETTITFNDGEDEAAIWSAQPKFQRKMGKLGVSVLKSSSGDRGRVSHWYRVPKSWIKVKPPITRKPVGVAAPKEQTSNEAVEE